MEIITSPLEIIKSLWNTSLFNEDPGVYILEVLFVYYVRVKLPKIIPN